MTNEIRQATPEDAMVVAQLLVEFNEEFDCETPGPDVLAARLTHLLPEESTHCFLYGEPVVGFALITLRTNVWYDGSVAILDEFYVKPHLRSQGIGTAIMQKCEADLRDRGVKLMEINVDGVDKDTQRFYRRHGYTNFDPGEPEPMYYFYKELDSTD